jgi:hypothetical protein
VTDNNIGILFRWPRFPVVIQSAVGLAGALNRRQVISVLADIQVSDSFPEVKVIDATGEEFWYETGHRVLSPGFATSRWTKARLIGLYAQFRPQKASSYEPKSLQNYRLDRVVADIATLLRSFGAA